MDLGTIIISIVCIALCAMPFALISRNRKNKVKQLLNSIKELAKQQHSDISQYEVLDYCIIGIDQTKNLIFFQKNVKDETEQLCVDLSNIKDCHISKKTSGNNTLERLDLVLLPTNNSTKQVNLEFYNLDLNYQLSGELESIEKWSLIIQKQLKQL
ncbi:hypothetical protein [Pseudotamlana agarivorans]|uniref:hypothetical protein n=1 Tax=Pseudotamlana agarivorans TaxID=481183 RepID=UPI00082F1010|nr:hypothetical protein [Tamlana agarivorans]